MKEKDYIYLLLAFILGYFANSIINQMCVPNVEGLGDNSTLSTYSGCTERAFDNYQEATAMNLSSPLSEQQMMVEGVKFSADRLNCVDKYIKSQ